MANDTNTISFLIDDLSGGIQRKSTKFQQDPNQVDMAINASFERIGGVGKILGYTQLGNAITTSSTSTSTSTTSTTSSSSTTSTTTTTTSTTSTTTSTTSTTTSTSTSTTTSTSTSTSSTTTA